MPERKVDYIDVSNLTPAQAEAAIKALKTRIVKAVPNEPVGLGATAGIGHLTFNKTGCPRCGAGPEHHEVRNYNEMWRDGEVYCTKCDAYVRMYDAG